jgi:hypothetical protein
MMKESALHAISRWEKILAETRNHEERNWIHETIWALKKYVDELRIKEAILNKRTVFLSKDFSRPNGRINY